MTAKTQPQSTRIAANLSAAELAAAMQAGYDFDERPPYRTLNEAIACAEFSTRFNRKAAEQEAARKKAKAIRHQRARFKANPWLRDVISD